MIAIKGFIAFLIVWAFLVSAFLFGGCVSSRGAVSVPADAVQEG